MKRIVTLIIIAAMITAPVGYAADLLRDGYGTAIQGVLFPSAAQSKSISSTATRSTAMTLPIIRVVSTTACFVSIGSSTVTATTSSHYLPANTVEYFLLRGNGYLSAVTSSATGTIYISEMN